MNDKPQISISVRSLVEFVLRSGDITEGHGRISQLEAMQAGSRIHRRIQSKMGPSYTPEVPLLIVINYDDYDLVVEGRADGIDGSMVDEIKGIYMDVSELDKPFEVHLAQAKCYAHMLCEQEGYENASVQMTYANLENEEVKRFLFEYTGAELKEWFDGIIDLYKRWADYEYYHSIERNDSIRELQFPFEYRKGQFELCKNVYITIRERSLLFLEAPTGTGKTLSTLFPSVKAMGEGLLQRIFYLTSKTITREVAKETLGIFKEKGYRGKSVFITAKDKICPLGAERKCDPQTCERAKGHFDRINDAVYDCLSNKDIFDRQEIESFAEDRCVCPFEMQLDLALWCDQIVGDVNYVFDPNVYLRRFFAEGTRKDYVLLADEAHNLVDRGRKMFSAELIKEDILELKRYFKEINFGVPKALASVNKVMLSYKKECDGFAKRRETDSLVIALMRAAGALEVFFKKEIPHPNMNEIRQEYFKIRDFLRVSDELGDDYMIYTEIRKNGDFAVVLDCIDPSAQLQRRLDGVRSAVFFSATLQPPMYYRNLLCRKEGPFSMRAGSIFPPENRCVIVGKDVSSVYKRRGPQEYRRFAEYITGIASAKAGNYLVFFPSYKMLSDIGDVVEEIGGERFCYLRQENDMDEKQREEFLVAFEDPHTDGPSLLGFAVAGGIFSEGIDLTGERLIGVIIAGVPLPQIGREREIIREHFDSKGMDGFAYAYLYPGMNSVLQAAGRLIRTTTDRGIIALLDERYLFPAYRDILPFSLAELKTSSVEESISIAREFWK